MTAHIWLVAALACAPLGEPAAPAAQDADAPRVARNPRESRTAPSKIAAVTVYQGQALVTREVAVPEGQGTVELIVTPLPAEAVDSSVYTEGTEALRVLSTRFRTRAVEDDTRREVRARQQELNTLQAEIRRLQAEIAVEDRNLRYLESLEGFTAATLRGLTDRGRLDSGAVLDLSRFVMETRGARAKAETDLREQLRARTESAEFVGRQLAGLSAGSSRVERDAVIVVNRTRREGGNVRLGYLVRSAGWRPQYRLRGGADGEPVRLEYLASVVQQTGEDWPDVRVTLSTARPSLDAAPPEVLPLEMAVADGDADDSGPIEAKDDRSRAVAAALGRVVPMSFPNETALEDVIKYVRGATAGPAFPDGIPIYLDPVGLQEAEKTPGSPVAIDLKHVPLRTTLRLVLDQLGLVYRLRDGVLRITSRDSADSQDAEVAFDWPSGREDPESDRAAGGAGLNQAAASEQADELRIVDGADAARSEAEKDTPSVSFAVKGRLDIPSRRDPQVLEVARVEMPADYYAKAVPVLTPRFYRLARLTNASDLVILPGEATILVGGDFVGRMRLPLVAAGEPFVAGFGVDPQLQVSRRLVRKARSVQGGNQVYTYEFRLGVRNYRSRPVKVQLWDRLPKPKGEAVAVHLDATSAPLSTDALYQRTARMDNLLRWDLDVPAGTVGDRTLYLNYEFRLEYARDLPQPRFVSGGLKENPIGGGAMGMGGMGGMGGGFRSVGPDAIDGTFGSSTTGHP